MLKVALTAEKSLRTMNYADVHGASEELVMSYLLWGVSTCASIAVNTKTKPEIVADSKKLLQISFLKPSLRSLFRRIFFDYSCCSRKVPSMPTGIAILVLLYMLIYNTLTRRKELAGEANLKCCQ